MLRPLVAIAFSLAAIPAFAADKYSSKDGKYAVLFPDKPTESVKEVDTAAGKIKMTTAAFEVRKDLAFMVIFNDYPDAVAKEDAQAVLERVRDGTKGPDGKVIEDKELTLGKDKIPGRDYILDKGDSHFFRSRTYLNGSRLYQVVISAGKKADVTSKEADKFLDSFEITK